MPKVEPGLVRCSSRATDSGGRKVRNLRGRARVGLYFRQAEVENFGVLAFGDEDICGLDVAVDDASGVGRVERVGDFDAQRERHLQFHRTSGDHVLEGHAVQELHDEESAAVVLADVVDGADVGMIQGGGRLGLAAETLQGLMILREIVGEEFQSDETAQTGVLGFVDDTHAATAELLHDPVMRDGLV